MKLGYFFSVVTFFAILCNSVAMGDVTYRLEGGTVSPGAQIRIPLVIESNHEVASFDFSIDFDEEVLFLKSVEPVFKKPDGKIDAFLFNIDNNNSRPGNQLPVSLNDWGEGWVAGGVVYDFNAAFTLPAGKASEVMVLDFTVKNEAKLSQTTIQFVTVPDHYIFLNNVTYLDGDLHSLTIEEPASVLVGAALKIASAPSFQRGDSNGDRKLDLSDAVRTLEFLFSGHKDLTCEDAADTNDSGSIDISDPVATLNFLFLGSQSSQPLGVCNIDQTEDSLTCESYPSCE